MITYTLKFGHYGSIKLEDVACYGATNSLRPTVLELEIKIDSSLTEKEVSRYIDKINHCDVAQRCNCAFILTKHDTGKIPNIAVGWINLYRPRLAVMYVAKLLRYMNEFPGVVKKYLYYLDKKKFDHDTALYLAHIFGLTKDRYEKQHIIYNVGKVYHKVSGAILYKFTHSEPFNAVPGTHGLQAAFIPDNVDSAALRSIMGRSEKILDSRPACGRVLKLIEEVYSEGDKKE